MSDRLSAPAGVIYPTAFLEGAAVIVIEIAGARALAPFFGTSLQVWTAQITVTLFFLAAGYGVGGLLTRKLKPVTLPMLFGLAGFFVAMYPLLRTPVLDFASRHLGVAIGSLTSAATLFGIPLLALGAVSPVLIAYIDGRKPGAGSAAGRLFFTNTMGGLAGGWLTAFVLIPHTSLRVSLVATGLALIVLGLLWMLTLRAPAGAVALVPMLLLAGYVFFFVKPPTVFRDKRNDVFELLYSQQTGIGLVQVLEYSNLRVLLIDGVLQGNMSLATGRALSQYIHSLHYLALSHLPQPKTALQLGTGAGLLPKDLAADGVKVTAVEIEPRIVEVAKKHFGLPDAIDVRIADARSFLRHDDAKYDLIFLDTFASESTPWHMLTKEAFEEMKERLNPGGRVLVNTVAYADAKEHALAGVETTMLKVFPQVIAYPGPAESESPDELVNIILVAGENLNARTDLGRGPNINAGLADLLSRARPAEASGMVCTDDRSNLDYAQSAMRAKWRVAIWDVLQSTILWD